MEEGTINDDTLIKNPTCGPIKELNEETILDDKTFNYIFAIQDPIKREREIAKIESIAKRFKQTRRFNSMLKKYSEGYIKDIKSKTSNITDFTNDKYKWIKNGKEINQLNCGNWFANDKGVWKEERNAIMDKIIVKASSIPIMPVERLINIDTETEKVKLAFFKDGKWKELIVEKNSISSKAKILQLANRGLEVTEDNAKNLIKYLADVLELNTFEPKQGITHIGWVNNDFIPYTDKYTYDGDISFKNVFEGVSEKGSYEKWKAKMKELRSKSKSLRFYMAASFASPLVKLFNINSFIVHLWGRSDTGKTVGQMTALSIWGNPSKKHLFGTFDNTKVANERLCNFLRNLPLGLDELQLAKGKYKDFDDMIYAFTEGKGRDRGSVDGGIRESSEWDNIILLSGEEPITSPTSKEGVKNRVIEIEDNEPIFLEDGKKVVNFILSNHGFAGKEFIEIIKNKDDLFDEFNEIVDYLSKDKKRKKQSNQLGVIALADRIVSKYIFEDKAFTIEEIKEYFTKDIDEADRYINLIIDIANANINNFYDINNNFPPSGQIWGKLDKTTDGRGAIMYYDFIPTKLYQILEENNISWNGIKKKMANKGYVKKDEKTGEYTTNTKMNGTQQRIIKIKNIYFAKD